MRRLLPIALALAACHSSPTAPAGAPCTPAGGSPLALGVGGVAVLSAPATMACVGLPASTAATDYVFIAANAYPIAGPATGYTVAAGATESAFPALAAAAAPAGALARRAPGPRALLPDFAREQHVRTAERQLLDVAAGRRYWAAARAGVGGVRGVRGVAGVGGAGGVPSPRVEAAVSAAAPGMGDTLTFHVPDGSAANLCTSYFTVRAVVQAIGAHGIIVRDTAAPAGGFTAADFDSIEAEIDAYTYPSDTSYFGGPTDLDNNGHVYVLYTPRVNSLTKPGASSFFAGFFFGGDLFPVSQCAESNVGEIFYLLVPDPTGTFGNVRSTALVRQVTRSTIAHELEHMINLGVRLRSPSPSVTIESIWLDEALAHFAEEYLGRAEDGFAPFERLTYANVTAKSNDYVAFYRNNLLSLADWLERPDTASATANTDQILADGGAAWALLHYTADQYAGGNLPGLTLPLVAGPDSGLPNLTSKAGVPFDSLMAGWLVAMYADGLGIPGLSTRYAFRSWNFRDVEAGLTGGAYPLQVEGLAAGTSVAAAAHPGSGDYFARASGPSTAAGFFRLLSSGGQPVSAPGTRLYILRAQ